jgi:CRP/FNR family transcriptional regulator
MINNSDSGEVYEDGAIIIQQGDAGSAMYVIQKGEVEVLRLHDGKAIRLAVLGQGDIFGELSLFGNNKRSATVRALGDTRVLAVEKNVFLRRIQEDLTLALRTFHNMAARLDHMNAELTVLKSAA